LRTATARTSPLRPNWRILVWPCPEMEPQQTNPGSFTTGADVRRKGGLSPSPFFGSIFVSRHCRRNNLSLRSTLGLLFYSFADPERVNMLRPGAGLWSPTAIPAPPPSPDYAEHLHSPRCESR